MNATLWSRIAFHHAVRALPYFANGAATHLHRVGVRPLAALGL